MGLGFRVNQQISVHFNEITTSNPGAPQVAARPQCLILKPLRRSIEEYTPVSSCASRPPRAITRQRCSTAPPRRTPMCLLTARRRGLSCTPPPSRAQPAPQRSPSSPSPAGTSSTACSASGGAEGQVRVAVVARVFRFAATSCCGSVRHAARDGVAVTSG